MTLDSFPGTAEGEVTIDRPAEGTPHAGKVLAAIQAHADDIPFFCAGTVAKLIKEGYTAYLIQTTNDDKCGPTPSYGETVLSNEREVDALARVLGFKQVFNLGYRNHFLDGESPIELRARLVFLIRLLKIDTVLTFNPWGHGERNPDHWYTGAAVEHASWMASGDKDYPEHFAAGLAPHAVTEWYYWVARGGQPYNRVVDVSGHVDTLVQAMSVNKSQGPAGSSGSALKKRLAAQGLRLPALEGDGRDGASPGSDEAADLAYIRLFLLDEYRALGARHGLEYAEAFKYIGSRRRSQVDEYVARHAERM
jgi:LmbE family N-acetylglucosaminyl deacetylase